MLPEANPHASSRKRSYALLGQLAAPNPSIVAECLFVDPVVDIAVLGRPNEQPGYEDGELADGYDADAFDELVEEATALPEVGDISRNATGWLLSLERQWKPCLLEVHRHPYGEGIPRKTLYITHASGGIVGGMSGSPILLDNGSVIVVISNSGGHMEPHTEGGPQPWLLHALPGALVQQLKTAKVQEQV